MPGNREMTACRIDSLAQADATLKNAASRTLLNHFRTEMERADGRLPIRAAIDPGALRTCLPRMAILDISNPLDPVYRLAGTEYCGFIGLDPTGRRYLDLVPAARRQAAAEAYVAIAAHGCAMVTNLVASSDRGRERLFEVLNVPVRDQSGSDDVRYVYVVFSPLDDFGWSWDRSDFSNYRTVMFRAFVDLGRGTPGTFNDLPVVPYRGGTPAAGTGGETSSKVHAAS